MATQSFYQDMVLTSNEELERVESAFKKAECRGPLESRDMSHVIEDEDEAIRLFLSVKI